MHLPGFQRGSSQGCAACATAVTELFAKDNQQRPEQSDRPRINSHSGKQSLGLNLAQRTFLLYFLPLGELGMCQNSRSMHEVVAICMQQGLHNLTYLNLSNCKLLTNASMQSLSSMKFATCLRELSISNCRLINDSGLSHLQNLRRLESLSLYGIPQVRGKLQALQFFTIHDFALTAEY